MPRLQHDWQARAGRPAQLAGSSLCPARGRSESILLRFWECPGLTVGAHRKFLEEIIGDFSKIGYRVVEDYRVLNAAHQGVPQNRHRLFLLGARKGFPL